MAVDAFGIDVLTPVQIAPAFARCEMSTFSLRLPESIHRTLKTLAEREGVSINQLINSAAAEKLAALMTEEYLEQRAARGSKRALKAVLAKVSDVEPEKHDQMPAGSGRRRRRAR